MLPKVEEIVFSHLNQAEMPRMDVEIRSRASLAGKCARSIGLSISGVPASNPPDGASLLNFAIGDFIHGLVQDAMLNHFPAARKEVESEIEGIMSGHCDLTYEAEDGGKVVCEIKSTADFAFMKSTGIALKSSGRWHKKDDPPEGPKREHLTQCAIYAQMLNADYMAIVYIRKTATKDEPVSYEWRFKTSEYAELANAEIARHAGIVEMVKNGILPDREFEGKIIEKPRDNRWPCLYCSHIDNCERLGPGEVNIK